jgi:hypothetical protein
MAYCVSTTIAVNAPLGFKLKEAKEKVKEIAQEYHIWHLNPTYYMSRELSGQKGSHFVISGVFNYWHWEDSSEFACELSEEFDEEVIIVSRTEHGEVHVGIFDQGRQLLHLQGKVDE